MKTWERLCVAAVASIALGGCASGFQTFYRPIATPAQIQAGRVDLPPVAPELVHGGYPAKETFDEMARHGYKAIGYSSFNGSRGSVDSALAEGKRVGADVVVVFDPQYTGTRSSVIPITTPTSQTTDYNGTITSIGSGDIASVSGTATTYGSQTSYIPIHVNRYNFFAVYLVKWRFHVGVQWHPLTNAQRQALGTNAGMVVSYVVDGSPAFLADVLPGDVVTAIDGRPLFWDDSTRAYLTEHYGMPVTFTIYRDGKYLTKTFVPTR